MGINANVSAGVRKNQAREKQEIASFQKYMTQSEMNKLQDATLTTAAKLDVIIHRMYAIGLHLPSEPCVAGILSMLWFSFSSVYILLLYVCVHGKCSLGTYILSRVIAATPCTGKGETHARSGKAHDLLLNINFSQKAYLYTHI